MIVANRKWLVAGLLILGGLATVALLLFLQPQKPLQVWTTGLRYYNFALSPDGQLLALAAESLQLRQVADGSIVRTLSKANGMGVREFSPDGALLATSS